MATTSSFCPSPIDPRIDQEESSKKTFVDLAILDVTSVTSHNKRKILSPLFSCWQKVPRTLMSNAESVERFYCLAISQA